MRKSLMLFSIILLAFSLVGCKQNNNQDNITTEIGNSTKFSQEEIE